MYIPDYDHVVLVDENDNQLGIEDKIKTHKTGLLHRAFSIFIIDSKNQMLLQQRAKIKYHSGGLWSNTCCSHPRINESIYDASKRRLKEEMGIECELKEIFAFTYKYKFNDCLYENEYDHVLLGIENKNPIPDPEEVEDWKWIDIESLADDINKNPEAYTYWFKISLKKVLKFILP